MNTHRVQPRLYVFRDGQELTDHPANGRPVLSLGFPSGRIGKAFCIESITVRTKIDWTLTEKDFDGPVSLKIWEPEKAPNWVGLANAETVSKINALARNAGK